MENIPIHVSARPERLEAGLIEALRGRRLPGWWLYEGSQQARRWLAYHQAWSPSRADSAMAEVYAQAFARAVEKMSAGQMAGAPMADGGNGNDSGRGSGMGDVNHAVGGGVDSATGSGLHVVGLGCGGGRKDAALLGAAMRRLDGGAAGALRYFPLDASTELVAEAMGAVERSLSGLPMSGLTMSFLSMSFLPMHPLVADLGAHPDLSEWLAQRNEQPEGPGKRQKEEEGAARLFTCFGMTPNFDHAAFPRYVRGLLRPGDGLLISANLSPRGMAADAQTILKQYDNPPAREWYAGALENLGLKQGAYKLEVCALPLLPDGSIWQVVVEAEIQQAAVLKAGGVQIPLRQGERLEVFFSNRFTRAAFAAVLAEAGLEVIQDWLHPNGEEGVFFCRESSPD